MHASTSKSSTFSQMAAVVVLGSTGTGNARRNATEFVARKTSDTKFNSVLGKSNMAVHVAKALGNAEIVNCDAMQVLFLFCFFCFCCCCFFTGLTHFVNADVQRI